MSIHESIEYFPLFDPETTEDAPRASAAVGSGVAAMGSPDALGGAGALVLYMYSKERNGWGYVGVVAGSTTPGSGGVRGLGASCVAFGDTIVVGAPGDNDTPGRVLVIRPPYGSWSYATVPLVTHLGRPGSAKADRFGASVAHCSDGTNDYIAVGAPSAAPPVGVQAPGQVFIFRGLETTDSPWSESPIPNAHSAAKDTDLFGASIAISAAEDGTLTLAVGAPGFDEGQGAAYVGRTTEPGTWTSPFRLGDPLVPNFPDATDDFRTSGFGTAVGISKGMTLAVGSTGDPNFETETEGTGAVWIYSLVDGAFTPAEPRLYGAGAEAMFGASLVFSEDALLVGAPGASSAVRYQFDATGPKFTQEAEFTRADAKAESRFGLSVAMSDYQNGTWCVVGAPGNPKGGLDGGGFLYAGGEPTPTWMQPPALMTEPQIRYVGMRMDWWQKYTPQIPKYLW
jgi:FG-GAP repeat